TRRSSGSSRRPSGRRTTAGRPQSRWPLPPREPRPPRRSPRQSPRRRRARRCRRARRPRPTSLRSRTRRPPAGRTTEPPDTSALPAPDLSSASAPVSLLVLGAGPAYTDRIGATGAAYLVRAGGKTLLLDLGQGSFPRLAAALDPSTVDLVAISHLHPDHFIDLVPLRHCLRWGMTPTGRVGVVAPRGLAERLAALHPEPPFTAGGRASTTP